MIISTKSRESEAGFSLIEVIVAIVLGAIIGVIFLTYLGTQLIQSSDPINIIRHEVAAEKWMERIVSDYVEEMNGANYTTALTTIFTRDYHDIDTVGIYNMPDSVTLTRTYVIYDAMGNEVAVTGGGTSNNLKVTVHAGGYGLTCILTAERTTSDDPTTYY
jgi:prepilin-type N-terminal cleavage/methylation domain-containing protein